jgi:hypothetical protein
MKAPMMVPVSCFPVSTATIRPTARPPTAVNPSPTRGSARPTSTRGERRPRLSIQSYEYGASRTWATHGHTAAAGAATFTPRHARHAGEATNSSHG